MFEYLLRLTLTVLTASVLSLMIIISGCMEPVTNSTKRMEMVLDVFPSAVGIYEISSSRGAEPRPGNAKIREIRGASGLLGYCIELEVAGRSGPFRIRVLVDTQLIVARAEVISYPWVHGRDVARRAFTDQFQGKSAEDPIKIGEDIDAMSGATISCDAMAEGVREAIKLLTK